MRWDGQGGEKGATERERYRFDFVSSCRTRGSARYKLAPFELLMVRYGSQLTQLNRGPVTSFHPRVSRVKWIKSTQRDRVRRYDWEFRPLGRYPKWPKKDIIARRRWADLTYHFLYYADSSGQICIIVFRDEVREKRLRWVRKQLKFQDFVIIIGKLVDKEC